MIPRTLGKVATELAKQYPVVTITGPRQSGKTTLARSLFGHLPYASLEAPDIRDFATRDPRSFLANHRDGAVLDEVQRVPELLSYVQERVDGDGRPGMFILTGSQNFGLLESITQSLAGRTAILHLLPFDLEELRGASLLPEDLHLHLFAGCYPPLHDRSIAPTRWYADYTATYLERDVRQVIQVRDLSAFQTFLGLVAGRSGQLLNLSSLAADAGLSHNTVKSWITILETSFITFRVPPFHRNVGKRLVKTPKLYFHDTGLLCYLLGIREPTQVAQHPLRGAIFETWAMGELVKLLRHRGRPCDLFFYRDHRGLEIDALVSLGLKWIALEFKSGRTVASDMLAPLHRFSEVVSPEETTRLLVYGGDEPQERSTATVVPWRELDQELLLLGAGGS